MHIRTRSAVVGLSLFAFLVAACGGGATPSPSASSAAPSVTPSVAASDAPSASASASASADATVQTGESEFGTILVDAEGRTLYAFTADTAGESTCYDACADAWPPLTVTGDPVAGEGVAALTTVERTDGSLQVKIGDWPLYYFANDTAPGQTRGQAVNDVWWVVSPEGELIEE